MADQAKDTAEKIMVLQRDFGDRVTHDDHTNMILAIYVLDPVKVFIVRYQVVLARFSSL